MKRDNYFKLEQIRNDIKYGRGSTKKERKELVERINGVLEKERSN